MIEQLPRSPRRRRAAARLWFRGAVVVALVGALTFMWIWAQSSQRRAIQSMPDDERGELYRRTLEDLRSVCAVERGPEMDAHCRSQSEFILDFAECDDACWRLARWQIVGPTR